LTKICPKISPPQHSAPAV